MNPWGKKIFKKKTKEPGERGFRQEVVRSGPVLDTFQTWRQKVLLIDWFEDVRGAKDVSRLQASGRVVMTSTERGSLLG